MFDWEDLRHFAALAQSKSLSAAARRLEVDHATVARRVAALEAALSLKLVDRRPRAYVLTADGERIAAIAAAVEDRALAVARAARAAQPGLAGTVTISAPPSIAAALIAPRLIALRERHPGIHVTLIGEKRKASLARREADLAVRLSRPSEKRLVIRRLGNFSFGLYGSPAYLAEHVEKNYAFIAYDDALENSPQQRWLKSIVGNRAIVLRANDLEIHREAARTGVGIAALPRFIGDRDDRLVRIDTRTKPPTREIWLLVHRDLRRAPTVRAVMEFLAECLA